MLSIVSAGALGLLMLPQRCMQAPLTSLRERAPCRMTSEADAEGSWRIDKARLDEQWSARVLKRTSRFLPFDAARQWARAMHLDTEEEWREWIVNGEKRNPYVPSNPDQIYNQTGWYADCGTNRGPEMLPTSTFLAGRAGTIF